MKKVFLLVLALVLAGVLCACGSPEKTIVGSWYSQNTVLGVVTEVSYTFRDDGTGVRSGLLNTEFSYYIEEDTLVLMSKTLGIEKTEEYLFSFEGDFLILTGEEETIRLEKKN